MDSALQIIEYLDIREAFPSQFRSGVISLAGFHYQGDEAESERRIHILTTVTDKIATSQGTGEFALDLLQQAGSRLTTLTIVPRQVRAIEYAVNNSPRILDALPQFAVNASEGIFIEQTTAYTRLVSRYYDSITCIMKAGNCLQAPGYGNPLLFALYILIRVLVYYTVSVEDNRWHVCCAGQAAPQDLWSNEISAACRKRLRNC